MIPDPVRLYNPKGPDRVAVVSAEPAARGEGSYLVRLARGPRAGSLGKGSVFGPYPVGGAGPSVRRDGRRRSAPRASTLPG